MLKENWVELFGKTFPIQGAVRRNRATTFPGKMTIGNTTRDDNVIADTWDFMSAHNGIGIIHGRFPQDQERYDFGTLNPMHPRQMTLSQKIHKFADLNLADTLIEYNERLYVTVGTVIYRVNLDTGTLDTLSESLPGPANAASIYYGNLYYLTNDGLVEYNVNTNTWNTYPDAGGYALISWDGKLIRLGLDNNVYWTVDPGDVDVETGSAWEEGGALPLPPGYCRQFLVYQDITGEPHVYAVSKVGLWVYDFDSYRFVQSSLTFPTVHSSGKGAADWRGELRVPVGEQVYLFNTNVIQEIGPNVDDGLPPQYNGEITSIVPGHGLYYALMDTGYADDTIEPIDPYYLDFDTSQVYNTDSFFIAQDRRGTVLVSTGTTWHVLHIDGDTGAGMGPGIVANVQGTYRMWFSTGSGLYWTFAPTSLHNPLRRPEFRFKESGWHETFWFDGGWYEMPKLGLGVELTAENMEYGGRIDVYAAWDEEESWEHLGRVTQNGRTSLNIGETRGKIFQSLKLRVEMVRGSNEATTPVLRNAILAYRRQPRKLSAFVVRIRLDKNEGNRTPTDMYYELLDIISKKETGTFSFKDTQDGRTRSYRVEITNNSSSETTGLSGHSMFELSMIEVDQQPYSG